MSDTVPESTIRPALTPEKWAMQATRRAPGVHIDRRADWGAMIDGETLHVGHGWVGGAERHALAALSLYGQPFGFTQEDVEILRAKAADAMLYTYEPTEPDAAGAVWFNRLADRIAALLPPTE